MKQFDYQLTGMAGEYLTIGKLFKRRLQASLTVGNAKATFRLQSLSGANSALSSLAAKENLKKDRLLSDNEGSGVK